MIIVSNRLPITVATTTNGFGIRPSNGGLVSAVAPILDESGGHWIGWTGTDYDERLISLLRSQRPRLGYSLVPVFLTAEERTSFYQGCSNEVFWPLFHGLSGRCKFDPAYWKSYCSVNDQFAAAVEQVEAPADFVWIHDYHLMLVGEALSRRGSRRRLAYFHHIPFPPPDIFEALPWRKEVLKGLMRFGVIGFQTPRDTQNFIACLRHCLADIWISPRGERMLVHSDHGTAIVGTYPISVDYRALEAQALSSEVEVQLQAIRNSLHATKIILGVDRLDYTKGIPERLTAFEQLLERHPDLRGKVSLVQIVVPSREEIPEYTDLKLRIETLIGKINGQYAALGWVPVHYFYRSVERAELIAFYKAAQVAWVTPLKDGMNLVAKEFCAARVDNRGVLVLSEFAGAAHELKRTALVVNPHDTEQMSSILHAALQMDEDEQQIRMETLRAYLRAHDVFRWSRTFTADAAPARWTARPRSLPENAVSLKFG